MIVSPTSDNDNAHRDTATSPSDWVVRFAPLLPFDGLVLDLACGTGRHARLLAGYGHSLLAIDRDREALAQLSEVEGVQTRAMNLEDGAGRPFARDGLAGRRFGGIVVTNYLYRPLLPDLIAALAPGGLLIYETFAHGNEAFGKPSNPAFLLRPGELLAAVQGHLTVIAYEHGLIERPNKAIVQRICARKDR